MAALLIVVFIASLWSGGFGDSSRLLLIMAGCVGLLASAYQSPVALSRALKRGPVVGLLGLTLLGLASLFWTEMEIDSSILLALTPAAYAGIAVFAACDPPLRKQGVLVSVWLATLATAAAVTGLIGIAFEVEPWAVLLGGRLRPAGFIDYPPALALLQIAAMPALAWGYLSARGPLQAIAGASLMIGAATIFLAQSRAVLVLAFLLVAVWVMWPRLTLRVNRRRIFYPVAIWLGGGFLLALALRLFDHGPAAVVCALILIVLPQLVLKAPTLIRWRPAASVHRGRGRGPAVVLVLSVAALVALAALAVPDRSSQGIQGEQGADHGRIGLWANSLDAIGEKPLLGHGQGTFLEATVDDQDSPVRFAHNLVVESAVELGLVGALLSAVVLLGSLLCAWKRRLDPTAWLYIPMVVGFVVLGLVDWVWYLTGIGAVWALCLGSILLSPSRGTTS